MNFFTPRTLLSLLIIAAVTGCGGATPTPTTSSRPVSPALQPTQPGVNVLDRYDVLGSDRLDQFSGLYNPATVITIRGAVTEISEVELNDEAKTKSLVIRLSSAGGAMTVSLGPVDFLKDNNISVRVTNQIEVTGSRVNRPRGVLVVARQVRKGRTNVDLREESGRPLWWTS